MGMSEARNLKVWAALLMAALALVLLAGVLLAKPAHAKAFTVNSTNHPGSGVCDATECTLEEAINEANDNGVSDTIGFASGLGGRGIVLAAATGGFFIENDTPDEAMDVRIVGPGGRVLAIDGNGQQVFVIAGATSQTSGAANAAIEGLTIKNGKASGTPSFGGGIFNAGTLTLSNSTVSGNTANYGGGIFNADNGTLTLTYSTVSGNTATNESGGGGIRNANTLTVTNSTLSGNSAPSGGGIYDGATATLKNTIVANSPSGGNCGGGITDGGHNLDSGTSCGFGTADNSLSGTDPMLGALADNGGPTLTHGLLAGSPAIDKGDSFGATADQRGVARPQGAASDIGAFEVDTTAPKVSAATPTGPDIGRGTNVVATFSEKMSPASITKSTFTLFKVTSSGTTQVTNVTVTPSSDGLKATLNPFGTSSSLLAAGTKYKAVVTTGARDLAGNALDQNSTTAGNQQKTWTFTTKG
jgi:hypothetical protein